MTKRAVVVPILVLGMAVALFFGIRSHGTRGDAEAGDQKTDDAYVRADQTPLSTRISGTVKRVAARDYQAVKAGQLLVEIDDADYQAMLKESEAALASASAEYSANQEAKRAADASVEASQTGIEQAQATVAAARGHRGNAGQPHAVGIRICTSTGTAEQQGGNQAAVRASPGDTIEFRRRSGGPQSGCGEGGGRSRWCAGGAIQCETAACRARREGSGPTRPNRCKEGCDRRGAG